MDVGRSTVPAGLALLALLLPVRSASQAIFAGSLALALISLALWGRWFGRAAIGVPRLAPWTSVYLGQFALLAAALPALALNRLAAFVTGTSFPLIVLVIAGTLAVAFSERRTLRLPERVNPLALLGLGSTALVLSIYSGHLSALGLDLHEHIAWIGPILGHGFVPLDEGATGIIGDYPRTFHLVTALWTAAGLGVPAGPYAKAMPFLQTILPALALAEQMVELRASGAPEARRKWEVAIGLALYVYAFLLVPTVYPSFDLSGTPRLSSGGLLLLPIVLVAVARASHAPLASLAAIACAPLLAAWALTWHPILLGLLPVVTLPLFLLFHAALRPPPMSPLRRQRAAAFAACCAISILALVQDPWTVQTAAQQIPACRRILERTGLVTFEEAVRQGRATAREKALREAPVTPRCRDARCVLRAAATAAADAFSVPWGAARSGATSLPGLLSPSLPWLRDAFKEALPIRLAVIADYAALPYLAFVWAGAVAWAWRHFRRRLAGTEISSLTGRILLASFAGTAAAGMGIAFVAGVAAPLIDQGHDSALAIAYLGSAGRHVSLCLLWLPFMAATLALVDPLIARGGAGLHPSPRPRAARAWAAAGLTVWLALPLLARLNLHRPIQARGFWTAIGFEDLRALRRVEAEIPPQDGVIIPAEHAVVNDWEHWILPLGETAALLPYGERRYLFNVYLGASYPLSWRDLTSSLCSADPAMRARFLERTRARWLLVRDLEAPNAAAALNRPQPRMCGGSFAGLGARLPAVREQRGMYLYRLESP